MTRVVLRSLAIEVLEVKYHFTAFLDGYDESSAHVNLSEISGEMSVSSVLQSGMVSAVPTLQISFSYNFTVTVVA